MEHSAQIWLPSNLYCHTTTISYWYVCLSCHGWFSLIQLSCRSGCETRLCSSLNHLQLLLLSITLVSHIDLQSSDFVEIEYRLDGGLFDLRRLQAKTKTSSAVISALQYADDAAFPSITADGLQHSHDVMSETYLRAGLIINTTRYKSLVHHHLMPKHSSLVGTSLKTLKISLTWAQIFHFLVSSQMRSKDVLTMRQQSLAI